MTKNNIIKNIIEIFTSRNDQITNLYKQEIYKYRRNQGIKLGLRYYSTKTNNQHLPIDKIDSILIDLINESIFNILVFKSNKHKLGEGVALSFTVNSKDKNFLDKLYNMLDRCGKIVQRKDYFCFNIKDIKSINEKVIPFLENCNLNNKKLVEFKSWKEAAILINNSSHGSLDGLNKIKIIKLSLTGLNLTSSNKELNIVPYGSNLSSTIGYKFTTVERSCIQIPINKRSIFVGILLSDANLQRVNKEGEVRLQFKQMYSHFEYFYSVFFELSHYCSNLPILNKVNLHKKIFFALSFTTRSLPCITKFFGLFYPEGKKVIPKNIYDLLTWEALVHWIFQKSNLRKDYLSCLKKKVYGLYINVEEYSYIDIVKLMNVLIIKYRLLISLATIKNKPYIYIKNKSMTKLFLNINPYFLSFYKIKK